MDKVCSKNNENTEDDMELISFRKTNTSVEENLMDLDNEEYILIQPNFLKDSGTDKINMNFNKSNKSSKGNSNLNTNNQCSESLERHISIEDSESYPLTNIQMQRAQKKDQTGKDRLLKHLMNNENSSKKTNVKQNFICNEICAPKSSERNSTENKENIINGIINGSNLVISTNLSRNNSQNGEFKTHINELKNKINEIAKETGGYNRCSDVQRSFSARSYHDKGSQINKNQNISNNANSCEREYENKEIFKQSKQYSSNMNQAFAQFCDQNGLSQKYIEPSSKYSQQEEYNRNQKRQSIKSNLRLEASKGCINSKCSSFLRLEDEFKKQHYLENSIEEYMVSNRKLQATLNLINEKYYNLKLKHAKCDVQRIDMKEHIEKLEQDLTLLSEKCSKLTTLKDLERINLNNIKEMAKLNQKVEETEKENLVLRKDKEMNKMLIEKQLRKIKELCQAVDKSRQGDDRDILDYEENVECSNIRSSSQKRKKRGSSQKREHSKHKNSESIKIISILQEVIGGSDPTQVTMLPVCSFPNTAPAGGRG